VDPEELVDQAALAGPIEGDQADLVDRMDQADLVDRMDQAALVGPIEVDPADQVVRLDREGRADLVEPTFRADVARRRAEQRRFHSRRAPGADVSSVTSG
jgi:hypothetical protein